MGHLDGGRRCHHGPLADPLSCGLPISESKAGLSATHPWRASPRTCLSLNHFGASSRVMRRGLWVVLTPGGSAVTWPQATWLAWVLLCPHSLVLNHFSCPLLNPVHFQGPLGQQQRLHVSGSGHTTCEIVARATATRS